MSCVSCSSNRGKVQSIILWQAGSEKEHNTKWICQIYFWSKQFLCNASKFSLQFEKKLSLILIDPDFISGKKWKLCDFIQIKISMNYFYRCKQWFLNSTFCHYESMFLSGCLGLIAEVTTSTCHFNSSKFGPSYTLLCRIAMYLYTYQNIVFLFIIIVFSAKIFPFTLYLQFVKS